MVEIACSNCGDDFSVSVELWWGRYNAEPRIVLCPHCKIYNIVTFVLRMEAKVHGIVSR